MAEHAHSTATTHEGLDAENLPEHERTYRRFLKITRYGIVAVAIVLIFLFWLWY